MIVKMDLCLRFFTCRGSLQLAASGFSKHTSIPVPAKNLQRFMSDFRRDSAKPFAKSSRTTDKDLDVLNQQKPDTNKIVGNVTSSSKAFRDRVPYQESGYSLSFLRNPPAGRELLNLRKKFIGRLIDVDRVAVVTAKGKNVTFRALVVVGDGKGCGGFGVGRGVNVRQAINRGFREALKQIVPLNFSPEGTLYHDVIGKHNNTLVLMRAVKSQNGIVASRIVDSVCQAVGIKHMVSKVLTKGRNPYSVLNAVFNGFSKHSHPDEIALVRGRKVERPYRE